MTSTSTVSNKAGGIKAIASGRSDTFMIDPRLLVIDPAFNARDFSSADNIAHVNALADSIEVEGVKEPLKIYMNGSVPTVTNGESRLRAINILIDRGVEIATVPVLTEQRHSNDADRLFTQITSNMGKSFTGVEMSGLFRRMLNIGLAVEQIAERTKMDPRRVTQILDYQTLPAKVLAMVKGGEVKITLAMETFVANGRDDKATVAALTGAVQNAKAAGKVTATKKHIGGEGGETKKSLAKTLKDERTELVTLFDDAQIIEDEEEPEISMITLPTAAANRLKEMLGL